MPSMHIQIMSFYKFVAMHFICHYNIANRAVQSNSVHVSVLQISIVHADCVSKSLCQKFFFVRAAIVSVGKNIQIFHDNNGYKQRLHPPVPKRRQFPTFSLGQEFLNEAEKEKNNGKETRHRRHHDSLQCSRVKWNFDRKTLW